MKWPKWSIRSQAPNDFLPIVIGGIMLAMSVPGFVAVLIAPDQNSGFLAPALLVLLGGGILLGAGFVIFGVRICSFPGSLAYRITHGRIFYR